MKKNIFMFWIGDKSVIESKIKFLESKGFNVVLGPTNEEDKILTRNHKYYSDAKKLKIYSFMSDIWRFDKLSKNNGLYIDVSSIIGEDIDKFYDEVSKNDIWLFKENKINIGSSIMYSSGSNKAKKFFKEILDRFDMDKYDIPYLFPYAPSIITIQLLQMGYKYSFNVETINGVRLDSLLSVRNKKTIFKYGSGGSWSAIAKRNKSSSFKDDKDNWQSLEDAWKNKKIFHPILLNDHKIFSEHNTYFSIWGARDWYDHRSTKKERKEIRELYKKYRPKSIDLPSRIIWSKLYRLFTLKK